MTSGTDTEEDGHISRGLIRLMMVIDDTYTRASRDIGLTSQQAQLLCAVQQPTAVGDIAQFLHCDRSNVSHLVNRASSRGLIERELTTTDGRLRLVGLSPDGQALVKKFTRTIGSHFEDVLADWPPERLQDALETLHALADALESPERT